MTRINLVDPSVLMDQHLFAEFREIKMIAPALKRSIEAAARRLSNQNYRLPDDIDGSLSAKRFVNVVCNEVLEKIPKQFTLNTGHVSFFYNKGTYLYKRFQLIVNELEARGINYDRDSVLDTTGLLSQRPFDGDYEPSERDLDIVKDRINLRLSQRPNWYRFYGTVVENPHI